MITTGVISELGDPDKLCGLENHVVLKFDKPWRPSRKSSSVQLPRSLHLEDDGQRITTTIRGFVENTKILCKGRVVAALFAGCTGFGSDGHLTSAAQKVLAGANRLVIIHNRDYVLHLVDWFRSLEVIVLHHDLRTQVIPKKWKRLQVRDKGQPQLKRLIGSTPAVGTEYLLLDRDVISALLKYCPQLYEVHTNMQTILDPRTSKSSSVLAANARLLTWSSLVLGIGLKNMRGKMIFPDLGRMPDLMTRAMEVFPRIQRLEVATSSIEAIIRIHRFTDVTDLSLTCLNSLVLPSQLLFRDEFMQLRLEHLSLKSVSGVSLSTIARNWPGLKSLSLLSCSVTEEKEISPGCLEGLVSLSLGLDNSCLGVQNQAMCTLLKAAKKLETLHIVGTGMCKLFLARCRQEPLPSLLRLTLATDVQLSGMGLTGDDLLCLVEALPTLRHAATDSYDLRLFFTHYMPFVTLDWCLCTICAAEYPRLDDAQKHLWLLLNSIE